VYDVRWFFITLIGHCIFHATTCAHAPRKYHWQWLPVWAITPNLAWTVATSMGHESDFAHNNHIQVTHMLLRQHAMDLDPQPVPPYLQPGNFELKSRLIYGEPWQKGLSAAYGKAWDKFKEFMRTIMNRPPLPASQNSICAYIAFLHYNEALKTNTIKSHLSAITSYHKLHSFPSLSTDIFKVEKLLIAYANLDPLPD